MNIFALMCSNFCASLSKPSLFAFSFFAVPLNPPKAGYLIKWPRKVWYAVICMHYNVAWTFHSLTFPIKPNKTGGYLIEWTRKFEVQRYRNSLPAARHPRWQEMSLRQQTAESVVGLVLTVGSVHTEAPHESQSIIWIVFFNLKPAVDSLLLYRACGCVIQYLSSPCSVGQKSVTA